MWRVLVVQAVAGEEGDGGGVAVVRGFIGEDCDGRGGEAPGG